MADEATIEDLIGYYVALLIIQYSSGNQPKAQATIALLAETLLADAVYLDVQDAYSLFDPTQIWDYGGLDWDVPGDVWDDAENLAVGPQLDVLGKYAGVNRFYSEEVLKNYFSLIQYDEVDSLPTSPPRFGLNTYATFNNNNYNGILQYSDIIATNNALTDANFLTLIQLAIINNNSNFSHAAIDNALEEFFGSAIRAESSGNMQMVFFVTSALTPLIQAIIAKGLLPKPIGVGANVIGGVNGKMFAFTDYTGYESPYGYGFSTYADYATLPGQVLTYQQMTQG